ncbi:MAG: hypothetical protein LKE64_06205 [Solobacterium sp.]|jgi:ribosome-binding protein aMBF1 (putative translation factor)|nr:hypothetical protein [Solobacterium sp.]MCH4013902.1 hypothetical protein [Solobacterium sp.]MCH4049182.1 hypothetical protein [Solobacterium sp.]MCH4049327.1 hypothetical protein [Solobacterium sp.]MCH4074064.1 hypothetical protein [Solobacterium sp.]
MSNRKSRQTDKCELLKDYWFIVKEARRKEQKLQKTQAANRWLRKEVIRLQEENDSLKREMELLQAIVDAKHELPF